MSGKEVTMQIPNSKDWKDLPKPLHCFTVRSASMINLNSGKIVRQYSANTKIVVVQKCVMPECTYYRTREAEHHYLNYAFKASAFGLPNEKAPSVPSSKPNSLEKSTTNKKSVKRTPSPIKKQKAAQKVAQPKGGEAKRHINWIARIFRRKNG